MDTHVQIDLPAIASQGKVVVNGVDISDQLSGVVIEGYVGELTQVFLRYAPPVHVEANLQVAGLRPWDGIERLRQRQANGNL
jgi:hypothetical protein